MGSFRIHADFALGFVVGVVFLLTLAAIASFTVVRKSTSYSLGHWKLNLDTPLKSMWMNVGYWYAYEHCLFEVELADLRGHRWVVRFLMIRRKTPEGQPIYNFEEACVALLKEIVAMSGILEISPAVHDPPGSLAILDLGFGCGDQTWELARLARSAGWSNFQYVGLTLDEVQVQAAYRKVHREVAVAGVGEIKLESFDLFCANAAKPETWSPRISRSVDSIADDKFTARWLLALDCIYHFSPSRKPILQYASSKLGAHFMAFDLILNESASKRDTWIARAIGVFMGCPVRSFLTESKYRDQLVECGYDRSSIMIRDITEDVFPGLVKFLDYQDRALGEYGISLGGFKLAQRLFDWFARSKVVKASIVIAHTKGKVN
ncbi:Fc.00g046450.m01.CDS01 [Cosmosporella sp. VM-42]